MPSPFDASTWDSTVKGGYAPPEGGSARPYVDPIRQQQLQEGHAPQREVGDLLREQAQRYDYEQQLRREAQSGAFINEEATGQRTRLRHERTHELAPDGPCDDCMADLRKANVIGMVTGFVIGAGILTAIYFTMRPKGEQPDFQPAE